MQGFQYKYGDRPLDGYTVHRGVGRGGFGEVFYAVSDSGREVALKAVQGYEDIELRGIRQCMNLKSPHLVTIFDVRFSDQDRPFVIMEYVDGPSLRDLLIESPSGLGAQKAAFFLREIAKGLTYLHDRGIVHRDLKPGNIFYEDGYVKIGDYGLSKAMTASQCSGQTITVGTVHYMAPEIGQGRYDQGIDVYALGVVLYEMLTGQVPFFGASPGEILMKHMATEPDLSQIDEPFKTVIRRAMAKDPTERYQTVQQMVEDVFGAEHVRESVSHFSPEELSAVAERIGKKVTAGAAAREGGSSGQPTVTLGSDVPPGQGSSNVYRQETDSNWWDDLGKRWGDWGARFGREMGEFGAKVGRHAGQHARHKHQWNQSDSWSDIEPFVHGDPSHDPLSAGKRHLLGITAAIIAGLGIGVLSPIGADAVLVTATASCWAILGAAFSMLLTRYSLGLQSESDVIRRIGYGGLACLFATMTALPVLVVNAVLGSGWPVDFTWILVSIYLALLLVNWQKRTNPARDERVSLGSAISAAIAGAIMAWIFGGDWALSTGMLGAVSLIAQVMAPYDPKHLRDDRRHMAEMKAFWQQRPGHTGPRQNDQAATPPPPPPVPPAPPRAGSAQPDGSGPASADPPGGPHDHRRPVKPQGQLIPPSLRALSLLGFVILLAVGLAGVIGGAVVGMSPGNDDELIIGLSVGVAGILLSFFCLFKAIQGRYVSWWSSVVKPLVMIACISGVLAPSLCLGCWDLPTDEVAVAIFIIIFSSILFIVAGLLPNAAMHSLFGGPVLQRTRPIPPENVSVRRRLWALLLACAGFAGLGGLHRFYVGKIGTGLIWLCTFGLFYLGTIYDLIMIALGRFRDRHGLPLIVWHSEDELYRSVGSMAGRRSADAPPVAAPDRAKEVAEPGHAPDPERARAAHQAGPQVPSSPRRFPSFAESFRPDVIVSSLLSGLGGIVLLAAILIGLAVAVDLPRIIASGTIDPVLAAEITREVGYADWPRLADRIGWIVSVSLMFLSMMLFVGARRRAGALHIFRAVAGTLGIMVTLDPALSHALADIRWEMVARMIAGDMVPQAVEFVLDDIHGRQMAAAAALAVVSLLTLVWPAPKILPPLEARSTDTASSERGT